MSELKVHYKFDNDMLDSSGNGYDGTEYHMAYDADTPGAWSSHSIMNPIASQSKIVSTWPEFSISGQTISFWLKPVNTYVHMWIHGTAGEMWSFRCFPDGKVLYCGDFGQGIFDDTDLPAGSIIQNEWHKYTYTRAPDGTAKFYRDATVLATGNHGTTFNPLGGFDVFINPLSYYLDDFRIYDGALTAGQVALLPWEDNKDFIAPEAFTPNRFDGDLKLYLGQDGVDIDVKSGQPIMDHGLENLAMISLFTKQGWWGNSIAKDDDSVIGSDFEEAAKQPITLTSLAIVEQSAEDALDSDKFGDVNVTVINPSGQRLDMVAVVRPPAESVEALAISSVGQRWVSQDRQGDV